MFNNHYLENLENPYEVKYPPIFKSQKLFNSLDVSVLDIETTGLEPLKDRIVSIAVFRSQFGKILEPFYLEIDPEMIIPPSSSAITGITNYSLKMKNAPTLDCVIDKIEEYIGDSTLVAQYASFDRAFVNPMVFLENGYTKRNWIENKDDFFLQGQFSGNAGREWLCTYRLAWHAFKDHYGYQNMSLTNEALRYWLEPDYIRSTDAHNALHDACTTMRVFQHICSYVETQMGVTDLKSLFALNDKLRKIETMPFGEYRDCLISEVPNDLLTWYVNNADRMDFETGMTLVEELNKRNNNPELNVVDPRKNIPNFNNAFGNGGMFKQTVKGNGVIVNTTTPVKQEISNLDIENAVLATLKDEQRAKLDAVNNKNSKSQIRVQQADKKPKVSWNFGAKQE